MVPTHDDDCPTTETGADEDCICGALADADLFGEDEPTEIETDKET